MVRFLRPFSRAVTYTRWLHLFVAILWPALWFFVISELPGFLGAAAVLALAALVPAVRTVEGLQARLLLLGLRHDDDAGRVVAAPSVTWSDRGRTALWLETRLLLGSLVAFLTFHLPLLSADLVRGSLGDGPALSPLLRIPGHHGWYTLLAPLPLLALAAVVLGAGELITVAARRLLGPSPAQRMAALEERTEQLLERTRIARELHDSIGHALTVAVVQAGAARAAADPAFTERALAAIEGTGRAALEDLERVLSVLQERDRRVGARPTLADADRLLESARAAGATVEAKVTGPLERLPGPVSREGYRILQESLTNVVRHAGAVPAQVDLRVAADVLVLEVRNPLDGGTAPGPGRGGGLRGIRERAALLGGHAVTGADRGDWRIRVELPLG
ncbi:histidine kinase [Streptomyces sp. DSM 41014]|uniref:histidine kinase n=1 Tax=Streptomyces hintoniae TaxID=3075521 RepID=A0ABU2UKU9_9ACTN|nr:histidine kinase [Streptomyces sp. DSM 41014]MDT0473891.1 histidine kinase [Streptomyces sp. DSM 41014]